MGQGPLLAKRKVHFNLQPEIQFFEVGGEDPNQGRISGPKFFPSNFVNFSDCAEESQTQENEETETSLYGEPSQGKYRRYSSQGKSPKHKLHRTIMALCKKAKQVKGVQELEEEITSFGEQAEKEHTQTASYLLAQERFETATNQDAVFDFRTISELSQQLRFQTEEPLNRRKLSIVSHWPPGGQKS